MKANFDLPINRLGAIQFYKILLIIFTLVIVAESSKAQVIKTIDYNNDHGINERVHIIDYFLDEYGKLSLVVRSGLMENTGYRFISINKQGEARIDFPLQIKKLNHPKIYAWLNNGFFLIYDSKNFSGFKKYRLTKIDIFGLIEWEKILKLKKPLYDVDLIETSDQGFLLTGVYRRPGNNYIGVVKTDSTAKILWQYYHEIPDRKEHTCYYLNYKNLFIPIKEIKDVGGNTQYIVIRSEMTCFGFDEGYINELAWLIVNDSGALIQSNINRYSENDGLMRAYADSNGIYCLNRYNLQQGFYLNVSKMDFRGKIVMSSDSVLFDNMKETEGGYFSKAQLTVGRDGNILCSPGTGITNSRYRVLPTALINPHGKLLKMNESYDLRFYPVDIRPDELRGGFTCLAYDDINFCYYNYGLWHFLGFDKTGYLDTDEYWTNLFIKEADSLGLYSDITNSLKKRIYLYLYAIEHTPDNKHAHWEVANLWMYAGEYKEAIKHFGWLVKNLKDDKTKQMEARAQLLVCKFMLYKGIEPKEEELPVFVAAENDPFIVERINFSKEAIERRSGSKFLRELRDVVLPLITSYTIITAGGCESDINKAFVLLADWFDSPKDKSAQARNRYIAGMVGIFASIYTERQIGKKIDDYLQELDNEYISGMPKPDFLTNSMSNDFCNRTQPKQVVSYNRDETVPGYSNDVNFNNIEGQYECTDMSSSAMAHIDPKHYKLGCHNETDETGYETTICNNPMNISINGNMIELYIRQIRDTKPLSVSNTQTIQGHSIRTRMECTARKIETVSIGSGIIGENNKATINIKSTTKDSGCDCTSTTQYPGGGQRQTMPQNISPSTFSHQNSVTIEFLNNGIVKLSNKNQYGSNSSTYKKISD